MGGNIYEPSAEGNWARYQIAYKPHLAGGKRENDHFSDIDAYISDSEETSHSIQRTVHGIVRGRQAKKVSIRRPKERGRMASPVPKPGT